MSPSPFATRKSRRRRPPTWFGRAGLVAAAIGTMRWSAGSIVTWDSEPSVAGIQSGSATWDTSSTRWQATNGANLAWNNASLDTAAFSGSGSYTVSLSSAMSVGGLNFVSGSPTLTGSSIALSGNIASTNDATIASNLSISGSAGKTGNGEILLGGNVNVTGTLTIASSTNGGALILGPGASWSGSGTVRQSGALKSATYTQSLTTMGLQFANGQSNTFSGAIVPTNGNDTPVLGVSGTGTQVRFTGYWQGDQSNEYSHLAITQGGKLTFATGSHLDLINNAYFTRQFWVYGDGTGTLEFEAGFVSDRTLNGTVDDGIGSYRLANVTLVTHHTQSLPAHVRPGGTGESLNGHLVWEAQGNGTWVVETNPQEYKGGLWVKANMTIDTHRDLTLSGVMTQWSDYTNYGGVWVQTAGAAITKTGAATLVISGDQAYTAGAIMNVLEGRVQFDSDCASGSTTSFTNLQSLLLSASNTGVLDFRSPVCRLASLALSGSSGATIAAGSVVNVADPGTNVANVTLAGGTLSGLGTVACEGTVINSGGTVSPGNSPGTLHIQGNYLQSGTGRLVIEITNAATDVLDITGTATLGGELVLDFTGFVGSPMGTSFSFLSASSISGGFTAVTPIGLGSGSILGDWANGSFSVVPEPASLAGFLGLGFLLKRRYKRRQ